jgi:hypothetical protein
VDSVSLNLTKLPKKEKEKEKDPAQRDYSNSIEIGLEVLEFLHEDRHTSRTE